MFLFRNMFLSSWTWDKEASPANDGALSQDEESKMSVRGDSHVNILQAAKSFMPKCAT